MFDEFSMRARQVVFAARFGAGQRGADKMEMGDLLLGLLIEDQGAIDDLFSSMHEAGGTLVSPLPAHSPFFLPEIARELRARIEGLLPQSEPISLSQELPLSAELERAFEGAKELQQMFHHAQIEPLHILAAILKHEEKPNECFKLLQDVGVTRELVMRTFTSSNES